MRQTFGRPCRSYQPPSVRGCGEPFSHFVWSLLSARSVGARERAWVGLELGDVAATGRWNQCWHSHSRISHCLKKKKKGRGGSGMGSRPRAKEWRGVVFTLAESLPTATQHRVSKRLAWRGIALDQKICTLTAQIIPQSRQMSHNICLSNRGCVFSRLWINCGNIPLRVTFWKIFNKFGFHPVVFAFKTEENLVITLFVTWYSHLQIMKCYQ